MPVVLSGTYSVHVLVVYSYKPTFTECKTTERLLSSQAPGATISRLHERHIISIPLCLTIAARAGTLVYRSTSFYCLSSAYCLYSVSPNCWSQSPWPIQGHGSLHVCTRVTPWRRGWGRCPSRKLLRGAEEQETRVVWRIIMIIIIIITYYNFQCLFLHASFLFSGWGQFW